MKKKFITLGALPAHPLPLPQAGGELLARFHHKSFSFYFSVLLILILSACETTPTTTAKSQRVMAPVDVTDLPGWSNDHVSEALPALKRSCDKMAHKKDWAQACADIAALQDNDDNGLRRVLQQDFRAYAVANGDNASGLFTGYYEAGLRGSVMRHAAYQTPIYAHPDDLITVDLGDFKDEWKGKHLSGKVVGQKLKPYDDRATIAGGSLDRRASVLAWVDDPVGAFFLAIQGSGRIVMENGSTLNVGYDTTNGRDYVAIGRIMADRGDIPRPVTMPAIRAWLAAHPDRAQQVMNADPSYVFFRPIQGDGPIGAQGVALTPQRSLAIDPSFIQLGAPVWLDTHDASGTPLQRLMVAQDTGGAIKGVVRGDFFWGFGPDAERQAGAMQSRGRYFVLLPISVTPHE